MIGENSFFNLVTLSVFASAIDQGGDEGHQEYCHVFSFATGF
jgi:hypothetical protein